MSHLLDIDLALWSLLLPWEVKFNKSWNTIFAIEIWLHIYNIIQPLATFQCYFHHMMPKFSCYSFMSARTLAKILNYLRGKYTPCQLLLAENAFFLLFQCLALLFQFGRWNPSCPSVQSFNSHIRSILLTIYFLFLLIRAFSTFASNVLFHAHQNSVDIYIFNISKTVKVSCSAAPNV